MHEKGPTTILHKPAKTWNENGFQPLSIPLDAFKCTVYILLHGRPNVTATFFFGHPSHPAN